METVFVFDKDEMIPMLQDEVKKILKTIGKDWQSVGNVGVDFDAKGITFCVYDQQGNLLIEKKSKV